VFILEHDFASKSFTAVREAFSNAHPDREVQNKTTAYTDWQQHFRWMLVFEKMVDIHCKAVLEVLTNKY
jgi:hypothetical protein